MRLFAAIALPETLKSRIALMQGGIPGARWVDRDNLHLTLAFIGEVDDETAERAAEACEAIRAASFQLKLHGCGLFSKGKHPESLWLGVEPNEDLMHLQKSLHRALEMARVPIEARKFTPHITLARLKHTDGERLAADIAEHSLFTAPAFAVNEFSLYESRETKNGRVYEALASFNL
jgi:2'-5' RNA ligase